MVTSIEAKLHSSKATFQRNCHFTWGTDGAAPTTMMEGAREISSDFRLARIPAFSSPGAALSEYRQVPRSDIKVDTDMAKLRVHVFALVLVVSIALIASMPSPDGGHHEHTHFIIHVPELIHKHHHTHVKKIHVKSHDEGDDDHGHEHIEEW